MSWFSKWWRPVDINPTRPTPTLAQWITTQHAAGQERANMRRRIERLEKQLDDLNQRFGRAMLDQLTTESQAAGMYDLPDEPPIQRPYVPPEVRRAVRRKVIAAAQRAQAQKHPSAQPVDIHGPRSLRGQPDPPTFTVSYNAAVSTIEQEL